MTSPPSLRDLYSDPSSTWSFVPPPPPPPVTPANATVIPVPVHHAGFQWSTRPAHNSIFDLSPDLNEASGFNAVQLLKAVTASIILQYTSSAIAMPWEVGKLLLQVQWIPREIQDSDAAETDEDEDALSDSSNEDDPYFADPESTPKLSHAQVDEQGYVRRTEEGPRPQYMIPTGTADGVWGMIKHIGRFRGEGWLALWKGLLTSCITEVLSSTFQPIVHNLIQSMFLPTTVLFNHPPLFFPIASHLVTGFLLSPLDLVRTRLIVQSFSPHHRTYSGPLDAFRQILRDEGGLKGIYLHPQLLIPTIIDNTLRPVVSLALPSMLVGYLGIQITEDSNPIAWGIAELAGSCIGLLVTLPFETVRRRLQAQVRGRAKPLKGCVELRPAPYNGVVDALWHILTEERSDLPIARHSKRRRMSTKGKEREGTPVAVPEEDGSWLRHSGIGQLYRGLGMRLGASAIVFVLALVSGGDNADSGWAEL